MEIEAKQNKSRLRSRIPLLALIIIGILLAGIAGRYIYLKIRYPEQEVLKGIPQSAILVAEGEGIRSFLDSLANHPVWFQGFSTEGMQNHLGVVAREISGFVKEDESIAKLFSSEPFAVSLVPRKMDGPAFLFAVRLPEGLRPAAVHHFLRKQWTSYQEKKLLELVFFERVLPDGRQLFIAIRDGILIGSTDREVFELGYYTLDSGNHILKDQSFSDAREQLAKSQNKAVRVFISYEGLYSWMTRFIKDDKRRLLSSLPDFGCWGAFDLKAEGALMRFQGFSGPDITEKGLQEALTEATQNLDDPGLALPANTLFYDQMLISSLREYRHQYLDQYIRNRDGGLKETYSVPADIISRVEAGIDSFMPECIVNARISSRDTAEGSNALLLLQTTRAPELLASLSGHFDTLSRQQYQDFVFYTVSTEYLIPAIFGSAYKTFVNPLITSWQNYLVIAPTQEALLTVLNQLSVGKLLSQQPQYTTMFQQVKGQMSRRVYFDRLEGESWLKVLVQEEKMELFLQSLPYIPQQFMAGFAKSGGTLLTDIAIQAQAEVSLPALGSEVLLDATLAVAPLILRDYRMNDYKVIAADETGSLYLLNDKAGIEWKMSTKEPPLSKLYAIDLFKNGRQQCLFLGRNMLHLVQVDGKYVPGFPVQIASPFSTGLSVLDYEKNGNYRCVYYDTKGHLANVDLSGRQVAGWIYPELRDAGYGLDYLRAGGQDFLIHTDSEGFIHFFDRRGKEKFQVKLSPGRSKQSEIAVVAKDGQPVFAWLDGAGLLRLAAMDGTLVKGEEMKFDPASWLTYNAEGLGGIAVAEPSALWSLDINLKAINKVPLASPLSMDVKPAPYHSGILLTARDVSMAPLLVAKPEMKLVNLSSRSVDFLSVWRSSPAASGYVVMAKGRVVMIEKL